MRKCIQKKYNMSKSPIVIKRLYELCLMTGIREMNIVIEIAIADSRNIHGNDCEENWGFRSNDGSVQLQAINCGVCGNYKLNDVPLTDKIRCECCFKPNNKSNNYNRELITKMKVYEGMDTFIDIVNPEGEKDLLFEDVVGEIFTYL